MKALVFATVFATLYASHTVADHWIQTGWQAAHKGQRDAEGRAACAAHVVSYLATQITAMLAVTVVCGLSMAWYAPLAGLLISAVTHYVADRRFPLEWIAAHWPERNGGKLAFYRLGQPRSFRAARWNDPRFVQGPPVTGFWEAPFADIDAPHLGTGAYALDQSWHIGWLFVAAIVTAGLS